MITEFWESLLQMYMYKQMITKTLYKALIFTRSRLLLNIILTINNNVYCCRYQTTDVITSYTLIVPCLVPVYIRYTQHWCGTRRNIWSIPCTCTGRFTVCCTISRTQSIWCFIPGIIKGCWINHYLSWSICRIIIGTLTTWHTFYCVNVIKTNSEIVAKTVENVDY